MVLRLLKTPHMVWSGHDWPAVGALFGCDNERVAAELIARGEAEVVEIPAPEAAVVEPAERAVKPKSRARKA